MKTKTQEAPRCTCGAVKPYRRAYACRDCWNRLTEGFKTALVKRNAPQRSLRLT